MNQKVIPVSKPFSIRTYALPLVAIASVIAWAYVGTFEQMLRKWSSDPQYSHGYLVPVFSLALLWMRRDALRDAPLRTSWWGVPLLAAGLGLRLAGAYFYIDWFEAVSLLPVLAGCCLLIGGWPALHWSWPAIAFLFFMIPLPFRVENALQLPLRRIGTVASVYAMQTCGLPALAEGNVIVVGEARIGVVEACSGLRMLMIFFALTTAAAIVSPRPLWERVSLVLSAVPIALAANIARITVTGSLHAIGRSDLADLVFHDLAGWLMMPFALGLLWIELERHHQPSREVMKHEVGEVGSTDRME